MYMCLLLRSSAVMGTGVKLVGVAVIIVGIAVIAASSDNIPGN